MLSTVALLFFLILCSSAGRAQHKYNQIQGLNGSTDASVCTVVVQALFQYIVILIIWLKRWKVTLSKYFSERNFLLFTPLNLSNSLSYIVIDKIFILLSNVSKIKS